MRFLIFLLAGLPALAEDIVTPDEFEALTTGKTLYFSRGGQFFGAEQYFKNREVYWQYADGQCTRGSWFAQGTNLCFRYDDVDGSQCWVMWHEGARMFARLVGDVSGAAAIELERKDELPLPCAGPDLGV